MEDTIKARLTAYLRYKGINKSEFGRIIGVSNAYISSIRKSIQPDKAEKIASSFPDLNITWLMTGEGDMLVNDCGVAIDVAANYDEQSAGIPFFDIEPAACGDLCGFGEAFTANNMTSRIVLPDMKAKQGDIFIKTKGRSMVDYEHPELSIPEGSIVLIREWKENYIAWGELYCVMTRSGYAVKRLMPAADDAHVSCVSADSEHYPPYTIALSDIVGIARVIGILTYKTV